MKRAVMDARAARVHAHDAAGARATAVANSTYRDGTNLIRFGFSSARNSEWAATDFGAATKRDHRLAPINWGETALDDENNKPPRASVGRDAKTITKDMSDSDLGKALRSVYQRAVNEDIPSEMLDLLGKLD